MDQGLLHAYFDCSSDLLCFPVSLSWNAEEDVEQPGSPSVKKSQEEGVVVVHEVKCKLYVKVSVQ